MTRRPLRVGLLSAGQEAGGVERYVTSLALSLVDRCQPVVLHIGASLDADALHNGGVETIAVAATEPGWRPSIGGETGRRSAVATAARVLPTTAVTETLLATLRVAAVERNRLHAREFLESLELDVLHVHNGGHPASAAALGYVLAAADARIAVRGLTVHGTPRPYAALQKSRERATDQRIWTAVHFISTVSQATARLLVDMRRAPPESVLVVDTGVEHLEATPSTRARQQLGLSGNAPVVAMLADMRAGKRHDLLVRATPFVREQHPDVSVLLAGEGPHQREVQRLVGRLGLEERVLTPGRLPRELVLGAASLVVLLSDGEALPLSLIEAMSAGLPVIGSDVGGVRELIAHNRTGILVPRGASPIDVGRIISTLLADDVKCRRLGEAARQAIAKRPTFAQMTDVYWNLYTRTSGRRP